MKSTWVRFLILAIIGFGLGAALAYVQGHENAAPAPVVSVPAPTDATAVAAQGESPVDTAMAPAIETPAAAATEGTAPAADAPVSSTEEAASSTTPAPEASPSPSSPVAGVTVGGPFTLVDHTGKTVTEASWPGKYKLVFFGFTHCPDLCPAALQKFSAVMDTLDPQGEKIVPLLITVDPARDTQEVMAKYISGYNAHIVGLTGTEEQVKAAEEAYKVYATKVPGASPDDYMVDHSGYMYLMHASGVLLETYSADESAESIVKKIKIQLHE